MCHTCFETTKEVFYGRNVIIENIVNLLALHNTVSLTNKLLVYCIDESAIFDVLTVR